MDQDHVYHEAKKRVKRKKGFYRHLAVYAIINTVMFFVVFLDGGTFEWLFPMAFWGIGLAIHYFGIFGLPGTGIGGTEWEARELSKEMDKMGETFEDLPLEELDLPEFQKQKRAWDDSDLV